MHPGLKHSGAIVLVGFVCSFLSGVPVTADAASGLFTKSPPATNTLVFSTRKDNEDAMFAGWVLQGLVNRASSTKAYVSNQERYLEQLKASLQPFETVPAFPGKNGGLRSMFKNNQHLIKKMFLYEAAKDWTWNLAVMASAQQDGLPVTESLRQSLSAEFNWTGTVEDFRNRWPDRIAAYEWALTNLMPHCNNKLVFSLKAGRLLPLYDYVISSGGFLFWLDAKKEATEIDKIFSHQGYGLGTSLMGYASNGDFANEAANKYGIGYVVSDLYANGSFWSSFPDKAHSQPRGLAALAQPGKVYLSLMWSDGDNISFDQNPLFDFWHDPARGSFPIATPLSPTLVELNPPLLDWYYSHKTEMDELIAGPTGFQFIYIGSYNENLFPAWCALTKGWCASAGFHCSRIWRAPNPSAKYNAYMKTCGFDGVIGEGGSMKPGEPPKVNTLGASDETNLFTVFTSVQPNPKAPVFINITCGVAGFNKKDGGYSAVKRQIDRALAAHPGRYVLQLPRDQFATMRAYGHLP